MSLSRHRRGALSETEAAARLREIDGADQRARLEDEHTADVVDAWKAAVARHGKPNVVAIVDPSDKWGRGFQGLDEDAGVSIVTASPAELATRLRAMGAKPAVVQRAGAPLERDEVRVVVLAGGGAGVWTHRYAGG